MINIAIVPMHVILYIDILGPTLATAPLDSPVPRPVSSERMKEDMHISQQSLVKILNKSTYLQTLSLKGVQLSDITVSHHEMCTMWHLLTLYHCTTCTGCGDCCWGYQ